ncbi:MAG: hypothetical protein BGO69_01750 [Bacteroidetes bacterium 46-16]|nr:MAG: hypothetical protein BGO69_01750 [Bacteroidetes bacterium 46-16]
MMMINKFIFFVSSMTSLTLTGIDNVLAQKIVATQVLYDFKGVTLYPFIYNVYDIVAENIPRKNLSLECDGLFIEKKDCRYVLQVKDTSAKKILVYNNKILFDSLSVYIDYGFSPFILTLKTDDNDMGPKYFFDSVQITWTRYPAPFNIDKKFSDYNLHVKDVQYTVLSFNAEIINKEKHFHYKELIHGNKFTESFREHLSDSGIVPFMSKGKPNKESEKMLKVTDAWLLDAYGHIHKAEDMILGFN